MILEGLRILHSITGERTFEESSGGASLQTIQVVELWSGRICCWRWQCPLPSLRVHKIEWYELTDLDFIRYHPSQTGIVRFIPQVSVTMITASNCIDLPFDPPMSRSLTQ